MLVKSPDDLLTEVRDLIADPGPMSRASVRGRLWTLEKHLELSGSAEPSQNFWILRAQLGTLDKFDSLFGRDRIEGPFELRGSTEFVREPRLAEVCGVEEPSDRS